MLSGVFPFELKCPCVSACQVCTSDRQVADFIRSKVLLPGELASEQFKAGINTRIRADRSSTYILPTQMLGGLVLGTLLPTWKGLAPLVKDRSNSPITPDDLR